MQCVVSRWRWHAHTIVLILLTIVMESECGKVSATVEGRVGLTESGKWIPDCAVRRVQVALARVHHCTDPFDHCYGIRRCRHSGGESGFRTVQCVVLQVHAHTIVLILLTIVMESECGKVSATEREREKDGIGQTIQNEYCYKLPG